jgi:hypothetical protein
LADLSPKTRLLLDAILMEFAKKAGVTWAMTEGQALTAMHDLMANGLIRLVSDGEEIRLEFADGASLQ